ncbi:MAG: PleD family two-component system response regulator [Rickettsiales bacterium]|nr:PleD family two-component system response regulator [Rickettsiales bacterium]
MTGLILVVDDVPANVKLLEAKLTNEYYDVVTAKDGYEAIAKAKEHKPDLVLLDVMMPGMDGFETCGQMKKDPDISHIPVVMVTALSEPSDRVQGLEAGADDFITKPINDTALFARVKSLIRIKVLIDELRLRDQSGTQLGVLDDALMGSADVSGAHIFVIDDDAVHAKRMDEHLSKMYNVKMFSDHKEALLAAKQERVDLIFISTSLMEIDGLRLATQFKAMEQIRHVPIVMMVDEDDQSLMLKALDLGVNDYIVTPVDFNEMMARVKTQIRRKKYQDALKSNYQESVSMAITDGLTGLYNRHYLDTHLSNMVESCLAKAKPMSLIIMDMDHFKPVNDTYGHDVGDEVLKQLAHIIIQSTRSADLSARYGGEEFVMLMPETNFQAARDVAERMRKTVESTPFKVSHEVGEINKTLSIGVSTLNLEGDLPEHLLKRADTALYQAKNSGRNQVCPADEKEAEELAEALQHMEVAAGGAAPAGAEEPATPEEFPYDQNLAFKINQQDKELEEAKDPVIYEVFRSDEN